MEPLEPPPISPPGPVPPSVLEPPTLPPPPDPEGGSAPSDFGGLGSRIEEIRARTVNMAGTLHQYEVSVFGRETSRPQELSPGHFQVWDRQQLEDFAGEAVYDDEEVDRLEKALGERRLLVITGEEEVGKGAI